jgi:hypothetical protein
VITVVTFTENNIKFTMGDGYATICRSHSRDTSDSDCSFFRCTGNVCERVCAINRGQKCVAIIRYTPQEDNKVLILNTTMNFEIKQDNKFTLTIYYLNMLPHIASPIRENVKIAEPATMKNVFFASLILAILSTCICCIDCLINNNHDHNQSNNYSTLCNTLAGDLTVTN